MSSVKSIKIPPKYSYEYYINKDKDMTMEEKKENIAMNKNTANIKNCKLSLYRTSY